MESKSRSELANSIRKAYQEDERIKREEARNKKQQEEKNKKRMQELVEEVFNDVEDDVLEHIEKLFAFDVKEIGMFDSEEFVFDYQKREDAYKKCKYPDTAICLECDKYIGYEGVNLIISIKNIIKKHFSSIEDLALLANNSYYSYYLMHDNYKAIFTRMIIEYATQENKYFGKKMGYIVLCEYMSFEANIDREYNGYNKVVIHIKINKKKLYNA